MPTLTLDGRTIEAKPGSTIIEAARASGIDIPHFCWHPKLSVSGNCRMCLVEVEKAPKLVIACATQAADGMVVHTASPRVLNAREAVMEFLLINHPLDCPICDEAGECKLQDYAYKHSIGSSRFDENKVHKPKRIALGPHVMLDAERCIMCSRCVRFCDEIARKPQLTFAQRGTHVELTTFPGESLDNPYSMNTIDLCPVGALTSRDFRFKARVWEMSSTETICPGCSRGCNMYSWVRNNEILRQTPRHNPEVNDEWMCDAGRLTTFVHVNAEDRIKSPLVRRERDEHFAEVGWDEALVHVASELRVFKKHEIGVIGSAYSTCEDSHVLRRFAQEVLGTRHVDFLPHRREGDEDDILIRADKTPNGMGAALIGLHAHEGGMTVREMMQAIREGTIRALLVVDDNIAADPAIEEALGRVQFLVTCFAFECELTRCADVVLPASTFAEKHGTFVNFQGRVQRLRPSVATLEADRAMDGFAVSRLDRFGTPFDRWARGSKRDARPTWRILTGLANVLGAKFRYQTAEDVFNDLAQNVDAFKGLNYRLIGTRGMNVRMPKESEAAR